ncbi:hypothetical protein BHE74_00009784 [Ensete ventricosum]|nr:hypothetical protein BHE74_00009784 [Ensete ventricosum]
MDVGERYGTVKFAGWQQPLEKRAKRSERRKEEEKTGGTDQQLDRWTGTDCRGTSATCGPALTGPADGDPATTCRCLLVPRERPRADTGPPSEIRSSPAKVLPHRVDAASNRRRFPGFFCERVPSTASVDLAGQSGARGNQQMIWREPPTANNAKAMGRDAHRGLTRQPVAWYRLCFGTADYICIAGEGDAHLHAREKGLVLFVNETLEKGSLVIRLMERSRACEYSAGVAGGAVGASAVRLSRASSSGGRS